MVLERYISNYNLEETFIKLVDFDSNEIITTGFGMDLFLDCYFSTFYVVTARSYNGYVAIYVQ